MLVVSTKDYSQHKSKVSDGWERCLFFVEGNIVVMVHWGRFLLQSENRWHSQPSITFFSLSVPPQNSIASYSG